MFAVAAGAVAAGGAALLLSDDIGPGPGNVPGFAGATERTYQVGEFTEIATVGPHDLVVTYGETPSVRAEGSAEALALLEPVVVNGKLTIQPRGGFNWGNWRSLAPATFYVTMPRLERVALAGSGDIRVDRVEGESFEGTIAGPGVLSILSMKVDRANFAIGGSGDVVASGTARETRIAIGGSGEVQGGGLRSERASVAIQGSGDVALTVQDTADISITGSGDVDISGPARCSVTQMGSGDVQCQGGGGTGDD